MRAFRLVKASLAHTALDGEGARRFGGRWNSPGRPMVYAASSLSLAALELLVHLRDPALLRRAYAYLALDAPDGLAQRLDPGQLPAGWRRPEHPLLKAMGDRWLESGASLALEVPSAVIPLEWNVLLNPLHPDWPQVASSVPVAFSFDPRLTD
jgi:RES domain-containing protein